MIHEELMELPNNLKILRRTKSLSQRKISTMIGVSHATYSNFENGRQIPNALSLLRLSKLYGVNTDALLKSDVIEKDTKTLQSISRFIPLVSLGVTSSEMYQIGNILFNDKHIAAEMGLEKDIIRTSPMNSLTKYFLTPLERYRFTICLLSHIYHVIWIDGSIHFLEEQLFQRMLESSEFKIKVSDKKRIYSCKTKNILPNKDAAYFKFFSIKKLFLFCLILATAADGIIKNVELEHVFKCAKELNVRSSDVNEMVDSIKKTIWTNSNQAKHSNSA